MHAIEISGDSVYSSRSLFNYHMFCRKHYYECPDDKTFRYLAQIYSHSHHNMSLSSEFRDGITNGADWYLLLTQA